jgi:hypothetical protein
MFALTVEINVLKRIIFFKFHDFPFNKNSAPNGVPWCIIRKDDIS